jgi:hypothetical protein
MVVKIMMMINNNNMEEGKRIRESKVEGVRECSKVVQ